MSENDMVEMAVQTGIRIAQLEKENEELRRRVEELEQTISNLMSGHSNPYTPTNLS